MQQGPGLDVRVEESDRAAHLRQPEPNAQEVGLVAHEQGDAVSFLQLHRVAENMGQPVAAGLNGPVRVAPSVVDDKRLIGDALRLLDEPIQDSGNARCQFEHLQFDAVTHHL